MVQQQFNALRVVREYSAMKGRVSITIDYTLTTNAMGNGWW